MTKETNKILKLGDRMKDGTIFAGVSSYPEGLMFVTPKDAPGNSKNWKAAMEYADNLNAHGHKDWELPTEMQLKTIFKNRARIGNFSKKQHYASTRVDEGDWYGNNPDNTTLAQSFKDGTMHWIDKEEKVFRVRPVRLEPLPPCYCDLL